MPSRTKRVRFETEYNSSFKAFDPDIYKSPLIAALIDEPRTTELDKTKTAAGLKSNKFLKSSEPSLQSKSKTGSHHDKTSETISNNKKHNVDTNNESNPVEIPKTRPKKNRALEYKAGLKPDNSFEQTKFPVSEYQREYEWEKFAIGDSPLLNAEKIVFDSHTNIPRFVRDKVPRRTEYQSKFAETERVARKEKKKNKDEHEENEENPPSAVKRLLQTSHNPEPPFFPHGSSNRVIHTEYQANFGSPKKYQYEEGIWLGAKPPHLLPDDQVLELREKARHYKVRAVEGTYFSREYLAQLDAELEQLYEKRSKTSHSRKRKESGHDDAALQPRSKPESPEKEDTSPRHSAGELGRPRVKHAWESEESSENIEDGKQVYRDLNEQFENVSLNSHSEHDSVHSGYEQDTHRTKPTHNKTVNPKHSPSGENTNKTRIKPSIIKTVHQKHSSTHHGTSKPGQTFKRDTQLLHDESNHSEYNGPVSKRDTNKTKPLLSKTVNHKHLPVFHGTTKSPQTMRRDAPLLQDVSPSHSENSGTVNKNETKASLSKTVNQKLLSTYNHGTRKPGQTIRGDVALLRNMSSGSDASSDLGEEHGTESEISQSPDKFNIKYIQGMHSNDIEAPSTSVRSIYGSESLSKSGYDSDSYLSQSSLASRKSVARQTLAHAKQRKENFW